MPRDGVELFSGWGEYSYWFRSYGGKIHEFDGFTRSARALAFGSINFGVTESVISMSVPLLYQTPPTDMLARIRKSSLG